ncbi:hypothetical protein [Azonexus sp.]|jgi:hypothetical protein|uniref:hypothetical protein n=1 Tax=Azonexus sp. TaxID=1872668 RepID=UPI00281963D9|nr:hypothetical protein [Azonexus sp.]MDR1995145.1 hypothetical protein [Azonexus sp.]
MSEHAILRAAIAAKLASVPGLGQVYNYERYAKSDADFREFYAAGDRLQGWHVRRVARRENAGSNEVLTTWELRGFMSIDDAAASELLFDELIDRILDAWRDDPTLGRAVLYPRDGADPVPQLEDSGPAMFCGILCHSARLKLVTRTVRDAGRPWD